MLGGRSFTLFSTGLHFIQFTMGACDFTTRTSSGRGGFRRVGVYTCFHGALSYTSDGCVACDVLGGDLHWATVTFFKLYVCGGVDLLEASGVSFGRVGGATSGCLVPACNRFPVTLANNGGTSLATSSNEIMVSFASNVNIGVFNMGSSN